MCVCECGFKSAMEVYRGQKATLGGWFILSTLPRKGLLFLPLWVLRASWPASFRGILLSLPLISQEDCWEYGSTSLATSSRFLHEFWGLNLAHQVSTATNTFNF